MAKNYTSILATAKRLIREAGREIILIKFDESDTDPSKPWMGPFDPTSNVKTSSLYAVAVPPSGSSSLGLKATQEDLLKSVEQILICETGESDPEEIETYNILRDGLIEYKINFVEKLKPGPTTLLYYIGVSR